MNDYSKYLFHPEGSPLQEMSADYIKSKLKSVRDRASELHDHAMKYVDKRNELMKGVPGYKQASHPNYPAAQMMTKVAHAKDSVANDLYNKARRVQDAARTHFFKQSRPDQAKQI